MPKPYMVKFPKEGDTIAVVASCWLTEDKEFCFWPLEMRGSEVMAMAERKGPPKANWGTYPVVVMARCSK